MGSTRRLKISQTSWVSQQMPANEAPRANAQEKATPLEKCALTPRGHGKSRA